MFLMFYVCSCVELDVECCGEHHKKQQHHHHDQQTVCMMCTKHKWNRNSDEWILWMKSEVWLSCKLIVKNVVCVYWYFCTGDQDLRLLRTFTINFFFWVLIILLINYFIKNLILLGSFSVTVSTIHKKCAFRRNWYTLTFFCCLRLYRSIAQTHTCMQKYFLSKTHTYTQNFLE